MYDLAVIGAGWAGFNAAIRAKELGLRACLIDQGPIGGTCLNQGCIPAKTLIQSAKIYSLVKKSPVFGITAGGGPEINFSEVIKRKEKMIRQLGSGMDFLLKGVDFIKSRAELLSAVKVKAGAGVIQAKNIIIATGAKPQELAQLKFDGVKIVSSSQMLDLTNIPEDLLIVGGGVIGCEFAGLFCALGSQVTLVEKMPQLLPGLDTDLARKLENLFKKKGIKVNTGSNIADYGINNYARVLVCVGRQPDFSGLGLEKAAVKIEKNRIAIDDYLTTNIPNIYSAGDCTGKFMLAHYAAYQGRIAVDNIFSKNKLKADNTTVPNCIFTDPQVAAVGLSQEEAISKGLRVKVSRFDFLGSAAARILDETEGFIKVISDDFTQQILGAAIIGPGACELIGIFTVAVSARLKVEKARDMIFAHPTLSESVRESLRG